MSEQITDFHLRATGSQKVESVIGPTLVIKGEVSAEEDLLIMGFVEGKIDHNQRLTIHAEGSVKATVRRLSVSDTGMSVYCWHLSLGTLAIAASSIS